MATMAEPSMISADDAAALVGIVADACIMSGPAETRRQFVMDRLCTLIGADYWTWAVAADLRPGALPVWVLHLHGGFTDGQLARFVEAQEHPDLAKLTAPFARALAESGQHVTRLRQQIDPEDNFRKSSLCKIYEALDIAPGIMSCRPVDATTLSAISIHRRYARPLFSERDARLAHIIISEIAWLHPGGASGDDLAAVPALSSRLRTVFMLLVAGQTRAQIAHHLSLSPNTVNDYVKDVFRLVGVNSQAQLLARFLSGNGGDGLSDPRTR